MGKILFIKEHFSGSLLITPSRRTPQIMIDLLNKEFCDKKDVFILDPHSKDNPYFAMLSLAKRIFVTDDSVSMISEACSSGKQVFIIPLKGLNRGKSQIFIQNLLDKDLISELDGEKTKNPKASSLNETQNIANIIKKDMVSTGKFIDSYFRE